MEREKFGMKDCDGDLSDTLKPYIEDGRSLEFGALLIQKIPASRLRIPNRRPDPAPTKPPQATIFSALKVQDVKGLWVLQENLEEWSMIKWKELKINSEKLPNVTPGDFVGLLQSGQQFGTHAQEENGYDVGIRRAFGIEQWPLRRGDPALRVAADKLDFEGLRRTTLRILDHGAPIRAETAIGNLLAMYCLHDGQPVNWIVVPPHHRHLLELRIRTAFGMFHEPSCSQFVKHLRVWLHPSLLKAWGVKYYEIQQEAGQLLFVFPGSYLWGYGTGFGVLERKHFSNTNWKMGNDSFCRLESEACRVEKYYGLLPQLSQEEFQAIEQASCAPKHRPRRSFGRRRKSSDPALEDFTENGKNGPKKRRLEDPGSNLEIAPLPQQQNAGSFESRIDPSLLLNGLSDIASDAFQASDNDDDDYGFTPLSQVLASDTKTQEINTLREDIIILDRDRGNIHRRKELYKARLHERELHIRFLEQHMHMQQLGAYDNNYNNRVLHDRDAFGAAAGEMLQPQQQQQQEQEEEEGGKEEEERGKEEEEQQWRYCALKAFDVLAERDSTIAEQEKAIREQERAIREQERVIKEQEQTIEAQKHRVGEVEKELVALKEKEALKVLGSQ